MTQVAPEAPPKLKARRRPKLKARNKNQFNFHGWMERVNFSLAKSLFQA